MHIRNSINAENNKFWKQEKYIFDRTLIEMITFILEGVPDLVRLEDFFRKCGVWGNPKEVVRKG